LEISLISLKIRHKTTYMLNNVKSAIGSRLIQEGVAQDGIAEAQRYVDEVLAQFWASLRSGDSSIDGPLPYDHTIS
jgi:hypothetical protein